MMLGLYSRLLNVYRFLKYILISIKYKLLYSSQYFVKQSLELNSDKGYTFFFTHSLGGGTAHYTNMYIDREPNTLLIQNYSYYKKDFLYVICDSSTGNKVYVKPSALINYLNTINVKSVIVNSLVSNYSYKEIINYVCYLTRINQIEVKYMLHDFHSVCPSINLMDGDCYCNLQCISKNCSFNFFEHATIDSIEQWRKTWSSLFSIATEIRAFSHSSRSIFSSAYPEINPEKISVVPHDLSYFNYEPVDTSHFPLHIGIFGDCRTIFKGKKIVSDFIKYADKHRIQVYIVGPTSKSDRIKSSSVHYIGKYKTEKMRDIIIANQIKVSLFPSVCPETFSYLVSELIILQMPVVCFNLGAQAEKIAKYSYGEVVSIGGSIEIYNALLKAVDKITND